ncbi:MAG: toxin-antitoxin system HicB family antitoxin [Dehalococcoidales bacterium]|nr:toxin-antitoxin system HicB family antitoxin [Dehalococcoidales bacterium]
MENNIQKKSKMRMIHVRIPEELHKRLRIRAAETEITMQDWVAGAIAHELERTKPKK